MTQPQGWGNFSYMSSSEFEQVGEHGIVITSYFLKN